ncbi:glycosyltransferase family 8 protein [Mycena polygramma]|nr:glycosyltransferase family 8 protein [Mycena polygramma]
MATDTGYTFTSTQDWVTDKTDTWRGLFTYVCANARVLEIGSWEGRSAVFLATELCGESGEIVCVDHFDLLGTAAGRERYRKITHNLELTKKPFRVVDEFSVPALMRLLSEEMQNPAPGYDWIYIDGSHEAADTFLDGELSWRLAKKGSIIIFDDYHWPAEPEGNIHHPKRGIDAFLLLHQDEFDLLSDPSDYQIILRKKSEMRIGFLLKPKSPAPAIVPEKDLGYGVNLAVAANSEFAMAAAVAIRSAVEKTCTEEDPTRFSVYVLDCGLSDDDKRMIRESIPAQDEVTIMFIDLPRNSLTERMGAVWAKVDMIRVLPVQRVLYLDGDVLVVEGSLKDLWKTDLGGKSLGAVRDVGFPNGHETKAAYFNAGVLLLDLEKCRQKIDQLEALSQKSLRFQDQDALNLHFRGDWVSLGQEWNAQGLGTYADLRSEDRDEMAVQLAIMKSQPRIVHFTGPVHPSMAEVLNPFVKYSAKPWGYASAPNNPFCAAWWRMLDKTQWRGTQTSDAYRESRKAKYEEALSTAASEFQKVFRKGT